MCRINWLVPRVFWGARVQVSSWCLAEKIKNWPKPTFRTWTKPCKNYGTSDLYKIYGSRNLWWKISAHSDLSPDPDPICRNSCLVLSMFYRLVLANILFSLRDIKLTLRRLPPRRHVVWRDSLGVESPRSGLKSECADIFYQRFLGP